MLSNPFILTVSNLALYGVSTVIQSLTPANFQNDCVLIKTKITSAGLSLIFNNSNPFKFC
jgi:hypothetical protein